MTRGVLRLEHTKSGKRREVPINADAFAALTHLGPRSEGRVFKVRDPRQSYRHAVRRAKLDDVSFHTFRHTFASWAMMKGASLKELQELLGHASLTMTIRYAHLAPSVSSRPSPGSTD